MDRRFTIPQVENAREYLLDFEPGIQERGMALWQGRAVAELFEQSRAEFEVIFIAIVRDKRRHRVELYCDHDSGWDVYCSCSAGSYCEHALAGMQALLQHATGSSAVAPPPARGASVPLGTAVANLPGRKLQPAELDILRRVELQQHAVRFSGRLSVWDLQAMGFGGKLQKPFIELPWTPHDSMEFLQLAVYLAREQAVVLPPFLEALAHDRVFTERIVQARRLPRTW